MIGKKQWSTWMKRRKVFKKKKATPKGYDSGLEYELHTGSLSEWSHHADKIPYVSSHTYEPDFQRTVDGNTVLVEVKGRFRENREAGKYLAVRECLPEDSELIFIFQDAAKPMPFTKKRKDGTKFTHGEWAERNAFRFYCCKEGLPDVIK
jgi:hypothetical protein